jgi:predicted P-loop ATPase
MSEIGQHIERVARQLYGEPNRHLSTKDELRFGTQGSLSVMIRGPKRGSWFSHEDQRGGGVFELLEYKLHLNNGEAVDWLKSKLGVSIGRVIAAEYDYVDEQGDVLFQVVRYIPKKFLQRRPDGRGGWIWKLGDIRRVPYRLPELMAAVQSGKTIFIPEGEKDVNRLYEAGLVATCNPGGAKKFDKLSAALFAGADVVVLPDNDNDGTGREHGQQVAKHLAPVAKRIRVLELPGLSDKGDVSKWLAVPGNSVKRLLELANSAPDWKTRPRNKSTPKDEPKAEATKSGEQAPGETMQAAGGVDLTGPWRDKLLRNGKGDIERVLANALIALRGAPEWQGVVGFDSFHQCVMLQATPPWSTGELKRPWADADDERTAEWLQHQRIMVAPGIASQAIGLIARDHSFHPVLDYLKRCKWDGEKRLDTWLYVYLGAKDTPYVRAVGAKWIISAVARVNEPGCKADCVLVLEGPQGAKKSTAVARLAGRWGTDEIAELGTKDAAQQLRGVWIIELAELESMTKGEVNRIKAFISRSTDRYRQSYGRLVAEYPRQCVFVGTANQYKYLRDETGNRRFWPVKCGVIKLDKLAEDRDQLWAEAYERYQNGEKWWLENDDIIKAARNEQRARYQEDAWLEPIREWLEPGGSGAEKDFVMIGEILNVALYLTTDKWTQRDQNRVAACMRVLEWLPARRRDATGKRQRGYFRPGVEVDEKERVADDEDE